MFEHIPKEKQKIDITEDLLEGIQQLGGVLRNETKAVSAWDLLDELGKDEKAKTHE
jgi:hypothetical protein